jgi:hypothetical protein
MARDFDIEGSAVPILVGVLCVLAVVMTAATLTSAQMSGGDSVAFAPQSAQDLVSQNIAEREGDQGNLSGSESGGNIQSGISLRICIEFLNSLTGTLVVFGSFVAVVAGIYRRYSLPIALLAGWILISPTLLFYFMFTNCAGEQTFGGMSQDDGGGPPIGESTIPVGEVPPWVLALLVGVVLVGAVGMLYRSLNEEEVVIPEEDEAEEDPELSEFAQAAGRAADRIEEHNAAVDNAVYRAWVEMTGLLNVDQPEMYTPGEFADAAIALGMGETDVRELTRLFNEVRYGGMDADVREDRAVEILRNIESEYGEEVESTDAGGQDEPDVDGSEPADDGGSDE